MAQRQQRHAAPEARASTNSAQRLLLTLTAPLDANNAVSTAQLHGFKSAEPRLSTPTAPLNTNNDNVNSAASEIQERIASPLNVNAASQRQQRSVNRAVSTGQRQRFFSAKHLLSMSTPPLDANNAASTAPCQRFRSAEPLPSLPAPPSNAVPTAQ
eukprot:3340904-Pyramimonas_sp.AAC.1